MRQLLLLLAFIALLLAPSVYSTALSSTQLASIRTLLLLIPGTGIVDDPCSFNGIVCANVSTTLQHVIEISLSNRAMSGEIPTTIGDLTSLQILDLSQNSLSGALPQSMAALLSLRSLNLGQQASPPPPLPLAHSALSFLTTHHRN